MRNYFKAFICPAVIVAVLGGVTFSACTEVDDKLGLGILPSEQDMLFCTHTMTDGGIDMHMGKGNFGYLKRVKAGTTNEFEYYFLDGSEGKGIPTQKLGMIRIGGMATEGFGSIDCGFMGQFIANESSFVLSNDSLSKDYYGPEAFENIDSVMMALTIIKIHGKSTAEQKFYVYEMTELLDRKKSYYANKDPNTAANLSNAIFSFTFKDEKVGMLSKKLTPEAGYEAFMRKMMSVQDMKLPDPDTDAGKTPKEIVPYENPNLFRDIIRGLCIIPAEQYADAAIYDIVLATEVEYSRYDYSFLSVHSQYKGVFYNKNTAEAGKDPVWKYKDTTVVALYSLDDNYYYKPGTSVGLISHDYTGSLVDESLFFDPTSGAVNQPISVSYTQGMLGVSSYIQFNDSFISELKGLLNNQQGKDWTAMMVNQAIMRVWLDNPTIEKQNVAPTRLGMYYGLLGDDKFSFSVLGSLTNYWSIDSIQTFSPNPIPDYLYPYESEKTGMLPYGGKLNRGEGHGYYEMDISSLIRQLANTKDEDMSEVNKGVWIAPEMTADAMFSPTQVALRNDHVTVTHPANVTNPKDPAYDPNIKRIKVDLVYTLLKPKK